MAMKNNLPRGVTDEYSLRECVIITVALIVTMLSPYWLFALPHLLFGWF